MRTCQSCNSPIPTNAKVCDQCGCEQKITIGGESARSFPEVEAVAEENRLQDQRIRRGALLVLLTIAGLISCASGISLGSLVIGTSTFFIALLALFVLFQVIGLDVGM